MGYGDEILATGLARGAKARGKRIAFGSQNKIIFSPWSEQMFRYNENIAFPGDERSDDLEWIQHHKGSRLYNKLAPSRMRWLWNTNFNPTPGELFFSDEELEFAEQFGSGFVLIEPNVPRHKSVANNKDWGHHKYSAVAKILSGEGYRVLQFNYPTVRHRLDSAALVTAPTFRHALAVLGRAALYIGPEGGLHHGAAADKLRASDKSLVAGPTPAVVLFGSFIPPKVTGYQMHTNLTGGAMEFCGRLSDCRHCRQAMGSISVDHVLGAARRYLRVAAVA